MMTLSTSTWLDYDVFTADAGHDIRALLDDLKAAGFDYVDANCWQFSDPGRPLSRNDWRDFAHKMREHADKIGVRFRQIHGATVNGMRWDDPDDPAAVAHMNAMNFRCVETAKILGADWMVMHPFNLPHDPLYSAQKAKEATIAYVAPYLELAKKLGVGIALENMVDYGGRRRRYCGGDPEELLDLVDTLADPSVGMCIDTGHAHASGIDVPSFIRAAGARLKCTHINDNLTDKDAHLPPFFGSVDWKETVRALREIGYEGDFSFEIGSQRFPTDTRRAWYRFVHDLGEDLLKL